jgi:hypothetical protein
MKTIKDIEIDLDELNKEKEKNLQDRMKFIDWWVDYIKTKKDSDWSKKQNNLINLKDEKI